MRSVGAGEVGVEVGATVGVRGAVVAEVAPVAGVAVVAGVTVAVGGIVVMGVTVAVGGAGRGADTEMTGSAVAVAVAGAPVSDTSAAAATTPRRALPLIRPTLFSHPYQTPGQNPSSTDSWTGVLVVSRTREVGAEAPHPAA
ncbi:hypothetical protein [Streptomyces flavofungini]|uniref:hypothetical protein n=1 Tax=Streptomyces flavofungini TaxID=68200 RepID=UPI0025AFDB66|nr:hypothetical protein [Streptomyces flavofungini]WJV47045.1 hypothetical protein QUY26_16845 [Streptomyces flavofungini]